jgi:hypothetical protein
MSDDLERRIHDAFHAGSLPPAPASLSDALDQVPAAPVRSRRRTRGRSVFGLLAAAVVLTTAGLLAVAVGSAPRPVPTTPSPTPAASVAVAPPIGTLRIGYTVLPVGGVSPTAVDVRKIVSILGARIAATGVAGGTVTVDGTDGIIVELPGVTGPDPFRTLIGHTGRAEFVPLGSTPGEVGKPIDAQRYPPLFGGDQVASASVGTDQNGGAAVDIVLKSEGTRLFGDYTAKNIGSFFAITLDGVVITAPVIQNGIPGGNLQITGGGLGGFDATEASMLATILRTGALPFPLQETSTEVLGLSSPSAP